MKRNLKKLISILLIAAIILPFTNVFAEDSITITDRGYVYPNAENSNRRESRYLTSKGYAYCVTPVRPGAPTGTTLSFMGNVNNGGLLYLMDHANSENEFEYLATQLAIWKYTTEYWPDYYNNNSDLAVVRRAEELINDAANNSGYKTPETSITLEYDGSEFDVLNPKMRYFDKPALKSGIFTAHITNGQSTSIELIGAPEGTKIYDMSANELTSLTNGTQFYIVVQTSSAPDGEINFKVKASANGVVKTLQRYSTGDGNYQDLVVMSTRASSDSDEMSFKVRGNSKVENKCEFIDGKYYDEDGNEIDQKTYLTTCEVHKCEKVDGYYFDEDGNITDVDTYDKQCVKHTCEIIGNTYYDSLGVITSYDEYRTQCELVSCEIINGKYFGNEGNIVTPQEFKNQCEAQIVPVPDTATSSIISIIIGSIMLAIAGKCVYKYRKNN